MKVAEALIERAALKSRLEQIKSRMEANVSVQEGNTPAEDIEYLMNSYLSMNVKFTDLICKINRTNQSISNSSGTTLAELITRRDNYKHLAKVYRDLYSAATFTQHRYARNEILYMRMVDATQLQNKIDEFSKRYRELDTEIQSINWTSDLIE
ncbi:MAG: DIP1984 family protein [Clostridia bacterium]|nr:DIP1984 family protein [Clostridia bacterium]